MSEPTYYIASLKHTNSGHEHITFWGAHHCGYTPVIGEKVGEYSQLDASLLNDGESHIAVPVDEVKKLLSPEPYYKPGGRFYDQRGPVVENSRKNWNALIRARLPISPYPSVEPKPEPFRGRRRAIFNEQGDVLA